MDLYGKMSNFEISFTKYDDNLNLFSKLTKKLIHLKVYKFKKSYLFKHVFSNIILLGYFIL